MIKGHILHKRYRVPKEIDVEVTKSEHFTCLQADWLYEGTTHNSYSLNSENWNWWFDRPQQVGRYRIDESHLEEIDPDFFVDTRSGEIYQKLMLRWGEYKLVPYGNSRDSVLHSNVRSRRRGHAAMRSNNHIPGIQSEMDDGQDHRNAKIYRSRL